MHRKLGIASIGALALVVACLASVSAAGKSSPVAVHTPRHVNTSGNVTVSFHPRGHLPRGGYYYAVLVLENYPHYSLKNPPPCAVSSNMSMTAYGYPHGNKPVHLTLTPAASTTKHWCPEGAYGGVIYAVPHKPPCSPAYPCYVRRSVYGEVTKESEVKGTVAPKEPTKEEVEREEREKKEREEKERVQPCGGMVCGVVTFPCDTRCEEERKAKQEAEQEPYSFPGGLPKPIDHRTRTAAHFQIHF